MNNINLTNKIKIYCIIFLCTLGAHAAPLPSTPDNAALLYYQAFLLLPEYDVILINPVLNGADPNQSVRDYVEGSREAIELADTATKIPNCNWGIMRSQPGRSFTNVISQLRLLNFLLELDARILTADGDYHPALERSLSIRRLAQHFADEATVGYLASIAIHNRAYLSIRHTLGAMSTGADDYFGYFARIQTSYAPYCGRSAGRIFKVKVILDCNVNLVPPTQCNDYDTIRVAWLLKLGLVP